MPVIDQEKPAVAPAPSAGGAFRVRSAGGAEMPMRSFASAAAGHRTITIVLADDHAGIRSALRLMLDAEDGFEVVADSGDVDSALRSVLSHEPAVLLLDLNMPGELTSLETIPRVCERSPGTAVVILTMQDDPSFARRTRELGALGYVLKDTADAELVNAVRHAADGAAREH